MTTSCGYPYVKSVVPMHDYKLLLTFDNGERKVFDASKMLCGMEGTWLGELLDKEYFDHVYVTDGVVTWPNEQDICPDCIYEDSVPCENSLFEDLKEGLEEAIAHAKGKIHCRTIKYIDGQRV